LLYTLKLYIVFYQTPHRQDRSRWENTAEGFYITDEVYLGCTFNLFSFDRLAKELQKCVKTKPEDFFLEKGSYCLGIFPDDGL
jgi:hypothetical protein